MEDARARDVVLRGMLREIQKGHDSSWCRKKMIGPLRRLLRPPVGASYAGQEMERARAEAEASVKRFCAGCTIPDCKGRKLDVGGP